jgi:hypothetical protein
VRLTAHPNPFNGRVNFNVVAAPDLSHLDLDVFDLRGRRIARIPVKLTGGRGDVSWNALSSDGNPLESGVYLCRSAHMAPGSVVRISYVK